MLVCLCYSFITKEVILHLWFVRTSLQTILTTVQTKWLLEYSEICNLYFFIKAVQKRALIYFFSTPNFEYDGDNRKMQSFEHWYKLALLPILRITIFMFKYLI